RDLTQRGLERKCQGRPARTKLQEKSHGKPTLTCTHTHTHTHTHTQCNKIVEQERRREKNRRERKDEGKGESHISMVMKGHLWEASQRRRKCFVYCLL
ncbi:Hypothetical predicted protein, partial [Podarcis lilfordi]